MNPGRDLTDRRVIHANGGLFVVLGFLSAGSLIAQTPTLRTVILLAVAIGSFCRFYY